MTLRETIEYVDSLDADELAALVDKLAPILLGHKMLLVAAISRASGPCARDIDQAIGEFVRDAAAIDAEIATAELRAD